MTIEPGDTFPDIQLRMMTQDGVRSQSTHEIFAGKRVVLFGVPGAFTPTCSDKHLPGFLMNASEIRDAGADLIACVGVNDAFVMHAWAKARNVGDRILMLADGNADLARALGLEFDASRFGEGIRSKRYAAILDNLEIEELAVEPEGGLTVSSAEAILERLRA
jgi:peroxiredoxin